MQTLAFTKTVGCDKRVIARDIDTDASPVFCGTSAGYR